MQLNDAKEIIEKVLKHYDEQVHSEELSLEEEEALENQFEEVLETFSRKEVNNILAELGGAEMMLEDDAEFGEIEDITIAGKKRRKWFDYLISKESKRVIRKKNWFEPETLDELEAALNRCINKGLKIKPYGGRHASSDVARPKKRNACLDLKKLRITAPVGSNNIGTYLGPTDGGHLVHIEAGVPLSLANKCLKGMNYALSNMGSYDGQSVIGAICTGTHGSNRDVGPMAELVKAIDMIHVNENGSLERVRFQCPGVNIPDPDYAITKIPDDANNPFYKMVVSMGCMGVVFGLVLKVEEEFYLSDTRTATNWEAVKPDFDSLKELEYADLIFNPNKTKHPVTGQLENFTLKTVRERIPMPDEIVKKPPFRDLAIVGQWLGAKLPKLANKLFTKNIRKRDKNLSGISKDTSSNIFLLGGNDFRSNSIEIAIPIDKASAAVDRIIQIAEAEKFIHSGPIGLRFVAASKHHLSFSYNQPVCTFEITSLKWHKRGKKHLRKLFFVLLEEFDGIPHWGQYNWTTREIASQKFEMFDEWLETYKVYNATRLFSNRFTKRMRLDS